MTLSLSEQKGMAIKLAKLFGSNTKEKKISQRKAEGFDIYRDGLKGGSVLLSSSKAGPCRNSSVVT